MNTFPYKINEIKEIISIKYPSQNISIIVFVVNSVLIGIDLYDIYIAQIYTSCKCIYGENIIYLLKI